MREIPGTVYLIDGVVSEVGSWHEAACVVPPGNNEKHGFIRSAVARKAAVKYHEIQANLILVLTAGSSPLQTWLHRRL